MREAAAKAVESIGSAAATDVILSRLAELMKDPDGFVREAAAKAIGTMMRLGVRFFRKGERLEAKWAKDLAEDP